MGKAFLHGNGGSGSSGGGVSFRVLGGITEPSSPKENDIWVNTETEITNYSFSASQPSDYVEGTIWICTDTYSPVEFNASKDNKIQICPLYVEQYINGTWNKKSAVSYKNGAWVDWATYLIQKGSVNSEVVTSFESCAYRPSTSSASAKTPTVTAIAGSYVMLVSDASSAGTYFSSTTIDLTKYKTVNIRVAAASTDDSSTYIRIGETSSKANNYTVGNVKTICSNGDSIANTVVSVDVSDVTSSRYIFVSLYGSGTKSIIFTDIWLE